MKREFTWNVWNYDGDGEAYVIAKDICPSAEKVPDFICDNDRINIAHKPEMVVEEGWCKFQCRTDWAGMDGEPRGGYLVEKIKEQPKDANGKKKRGWFPVWIVRTKQ